MTFDPTATLRSMQQTLDDTALFVNVQIGEPFSPPADLTAALMFRGWAPSSMTLSGTIDSLELTLRIYARAGMTPEDAESVELGLGVLWFQLESAFAGGFTLDGTVRAINWAGEEAGPKLGAQWGHVVIGGTIFRVIDVVLPVIVDDAGSFAA